MMKEKRKQTSKSEAGKLFLYGIFSFCIVLILFAFTSYCSHCSLQNKSEKIQTPLLEPAFPLAISEHSKPDTLEPPASTPQKFSGLIELILIPENEEWLVASVNPVLGKLQRNEVKPILLVLSDFSKYSESSFFKNIDPLHTMIIASSLENDLLESLPAFHYRFLPTGKDPTNAGIQIMKTFWESTEEVVIASNREPRSAIFGSMLAAHLSIPFIQWQGEERIKELLDNLSDLGIKKVLFSINSTTIRPYVPKVPLEVKFYDHQGIMHTMIEKIQPENIDNIIVSREPYGIVDGFTASWILPYMSLIRKAPIVISHTNEPHEIEELVFNLTTQYSLKPRTITLLGDYNAISQWELQDPDIYDDEKIEIEPCSMDFDKEVAVFGVGRIPFNRLSEASALIARTHLYEKLSEKRTPSVLMIANPDSTFGNLPLCETISRLTAKEFKNHKIPIDEFYGKETTDDCLPDIAQKAGLIIFEGHIFDLTLFEKPDDYLYIEDILEDCESPILNFDYNSDDNNLADDYYKDFLDNFSPQEVSAVSLIPQEIPETLLMPSLIDKSLEGQALLILQSCHSLKDEVPDPIFNLGGSGVIGTLSNIHSASGSAFIKAFCDGLLYRGDTVGEALRDARNYFLCLAKLKEKRGHQEQNKVLRVAYSFNLWGDPEMQMGLNRAKRLRLLPVSGQWVNRKEFSIATPARRLPKVETERYYAGLYPGSQVAGIVKRLKNNPKQRKIMPLYFLKLPYPEGLIIDEDTTLKVYEGEIDSTSSVFLKDPLNRFIYILYFPPQSAKNSTTLFRFENN